MTTAVSAGAERRAHSWSSPYAPSRTAESDAYVDYASDSALPPALHALTAVETRRGSLLLQAPVPTTSGLVDWVSKHSKDVWDGPAALLAELARQFRPESSANTEAAASPRITYTLIVPPGTHAGSAANMALAESAGTDSTRVPFSRPPFIIGPEIPALAPPISLLIEKRPVRVPLLVPMAETTVGSALSPRPHTDRFVQQLFASAKDQVFEPGMESQFSRLLVSLVEEFNSNVIDEMARLILGGHVSDEAAYETLQWLGRMEHPHSRQRRFWLLTQALQGKTPMVRDGAALGLSLLDDPRAVWALERAIAYEKDQDLRSDMLQVLRQLRGSPASR